MTSITGNHKGCVETTSGCTDQSKPQTINSVHPSDKYFFCLHQSLTSSTETNGLFIERVDLASPAGINSLGLVKS